jgi:hypothetical protein
MSIYDLQKQKLQGCLDEKWPSETRKICLVITALVIKEL